MEPIRAILPNNTALGSEPFDHVAFVHKQVEWYNAAEGHLNEEDGYDCPICRNKGHIQYVKDDNGIPKTWIRDCKCEKTRATIRRMRRSGLKDIIRDYTFEKFQATEPWQQTIKASAMEYAKTMDGWFFIGGQSGCGKTHICTAICREALLRGQEVRYMLWRDDISKIKAVVNQADEYAAAIGPYKNAEILYVDDLFKTGKGPDGNAQRPTTGDVNAAFEILNYRYNAKLPTVISSECTISDLLDIDEAVAGRIVELAKVFSLKHDRSRNYRLRKVVEL